MVRKQTAMQKLPMILSAAESSDLILREHHWDMAQELMDKIESKIPIMLREGQSANTTNQTGVNAAIFKALKDKDTGMRESSLVGKLVLEGHNGDEIRKTIYNLCSASDVLQKRGENILLVGDPNLYI